MHEWASARRKRLESTASVFRVVRLQKHNHFHSGREFSANPATFAATFVTSTEGFATRSGRRQTTRCSLLVWLFVGFAPTEHESTAQGTFAV